MPLSKNSQEIVDYVLSLSPEQYDAFIQKLDADQANYLDVILEKLEKEESNANPNKGTDPKASTKGTSPENPSQERAIEEGPSL